MQAVKWVVAKLQGEKTASFCKKMCGREAHGENLNGHPLYGHWRMAKNGQQKTPRSFSHFFACFRSFSTVFALFARFRTFLSVFLAFLAVRFRTF